ncbi:large ribosomal subunit protein bL20m [Euwallacea similis]|uniref:large ribosomal subunit protein bL20m n=1 Tax=Euwallacea similis TaxID=1736056 RepID=UPI00344C0294
MVFTSAVNFIRSRGPDEFWRKRKIFKLSAHYFGRPRNCYSLAIRNVHRALAYATKGRKLKKMDMLDLWTTRIKAACNQHEIEYGLFKTSLRDLDILLNKKTLSDLAIWEPYSFKALTDIAKRKVLDDGLSFIKNETEVDKVITRGMLSTHK